MSIYKKFTAQDIALVPFNAHKQYNFSSGSASSNSIKHFNSRWTSESISVYSSGSLTSYGLPADSINAVKYSQIDHLFYKNFRKDIGSRFGNKHYLKQKRDLYDCANILSIPTGLYGFEVKPGTFYLSSSNYLIVDDTHGNLMISGTKVSDYLTDPRSNLFRLDPIKAFRNYDLNIFEDYYNDVFYLDGKKRINLVLNYNSPEQGEFDDSYYLNPIRYEQVHFTTSSLGANKCKFGSIGLNSNNPSRIVSPDNEKFNFNQDDDFSITFNFQIIPQYQKLSSKGLIEPPEVGDIIEDGIVFHVTGSEAFLVVSADPNTLTDGYVQTHDIFSTISSVNDSNGDSNLTIGAESNEPKMLAVDVGSSTYTNATGHLGPHNAFQISGSTGGITGSNFRFATDKTIFEYLGTFQGGGTSPITLIAGKPTPFIGGGELNTQNILDFVATTDDAPLFDYVRNGGTPQKRTDTWIANYDEVNLVAQTLGFTNDKTQAADNKNIYLAVNRNGTEKNQNVFDLGVANINIGAGDGFGFSISAATIITSNFLPESGSINAVGSTLNNVFDPNELDSVFVGIREDGTLLEADGNFDITTPGDGNLRPYHIPSHLHSTYSSANILIVRKINWEELDHAKRYIITKSTTKTVVPSPTEGQADFVTTNTSGALQFKDVPAEPQFPFSIYHQSNSIYFERSDGDRTTTVVGEANTYLVNQRNQVVCQKSGSLMKISLNGTLLASGTDITTKQTQNNANLYIGSKGNDSISEDLYLNTTGELTNYDHQLLSSSARYFNGYLENINIYEEAVTQTKELKMLQSVNHSPYIGNIFYQNGFAVITHPKYLDALSGSSGLGTINQLKFQGSHLIYEHEYQCTIQEDEFNDTLNISARKIKSHQSPDLDDFATGSLFRPYITTVGLYNENNELLVVGKLGQPLRASDETDTTIVLRWDT